MQPTARVSPALAVDYDMPALMQENCQASLVWQPRIDINSDIYAAARDISEHHLVTAARAR